MTWMKIGLLFSALASPAVHAQAFVGPTTYPVPAHLQLANPTTDTSPVQTSLRPTPSVSGDLYYVSSMGSVPRYIAGGLLGTLLGLGIGHAVNGTWREIGRVFTYGEIIAIGSLTTGLMMTGFDLDGSDLGTAMFVNGMIVYVGLRIWEIVDVWLRPIIKGYVAQAHSHRLALVPLVGPDTQGFGLSARF